MTEPHPSYAGIPEHIRHSLMLYVTEGVRPGKGLSSILSNNLFGAVGCCDDATLAALRPIVTWLYSFAPGECHSSGDKLESWLVRNLYAGRCYDTEEGLTKLGYPEEAARYRK